MHVTVFEMRLFSVLNKFGANKIYARNGEVILRRTSLRAYEIRDRIKIWRVGGQCTDFLTLTYLDSVEKTITSDFVLPDLSQAAELQEETKSQKITLDDAQNDDK
jgi:hypothetical protein